jgi:hypothetical protein
LLFCPICSIVQCLYSCHIQAHTHIISPVAQLLVSLQPCPSEFSEFYLNPFCSSPIASAPDSEVPNSFLFQSDCICTQFRSTRIIFERILLYLPIRLHLRPIPKHPTCSFSNPIAPAPDSEAPELFARLFPLPIWLHLQTIPKRWTFFEPILVHLPVQLHQLIISEDGSLQRYDF